MGSNSPFIDLTGQKFGEITVIKRAPNSGGNSRARWLCECSCGKVKIMRGDVLRHGAKSCGCKSAYKHGFCVGSKPSRLYTIWRDMRSRCSNPGNIGFHQYGGRGITVCEEWQNSFEAFSKWALENGYRDDLTIDRMNVNGNYDPSNCRWITNSSQQRNKRNTTLVTVHGVTKPLIEWAEILGVSKSSLIHRKQRGTLQTYLDSAITDADLLGGDRE